MKTFSLAKLFAPSLLVLTLAACGGGGSDGGDDTGTSTTPPSTGGTGGSSGGGSDGGSGDPDEGDGNNDNDGDGGVGISIEGIGFNLAGSAALQALSEGVTADEASSTMSSAGDRVLFGYREADPFDARLMSEGGEAVTNLLAVDEEGNTTLAVESEWPMKVEYSVMSPEGDYVYIALSDEYEDNIDYSEVIAQTNCGLFKVSIDDNSFECAAEGLKVQPMNDDHFQSVSNNSKPLLVDSEGSVYFAALEFTSDCGESGDWCSVNIDNWNAQIYSVSPDGELKTITNDLQYIENFQVLGDGRVVYYGYNDAVQRNELNIFNDPGTSLLSETWGVEFYTVDQDQTVIFGDWSSNDIRFAKPRSEGGILRTTLDTRLFGEDESGNYYPIRVLTGDNGRVYGIFESSRYVEREDGESDWVNSLTVYQVLPYDPVPKASVQLPDGMGHWNFIGRTPFQINKGFLYYTERVTVPYQGENDVIRMVNLNTGDVETLLDDNFEEERFRMHNWRLSGDTLFFSAQNNANTTTVMGEIDTLAVRDGEENVLSLREVTSARGAALEVKDIEILRPQQPAVDTGNSPEAQVYMEPENRFSVSVDFTKYMNRSSVLENLTLSESSGADVDVLPIWYYQSLHLIPDTSDLGLGDNLRGSLKHDTEYELAISADARDAYDWDLLEVSESFKTLPSEGWLVRDNTNEVKGIAEGQYAMFLGFLKEDSNGSYATTEMGFRHQADAKAVEVPDNFSLEFSSREIAYGGINLRVRRVNAEGDEDTVVDFSIESWGASLTYSSDTFMGNQWADISNNSLLNSEWSRYRLTKVDGEIKLFKLNEAGEMAQIKFEHWVDGENQESDIVDAAAFDTGYTHVLEMQQSRPIVLDKLTLTELNADGTVKEEVFSEDFNALSVDQLREIIAEPLDSTELNTKP